jgi:nucleoside-diphosphate-sugar epimerase
MVSCNPTINLQGQVTTYHTADINNRNDICKLLSQIKPRVIFHAASLAEAHAGTIPQLEFHNTNVLGTRNLPKCVTENPSVDVLVYTSTCFIAKGHQHFNQDENAPTWDETSKVDAYNKSKALANAIAPNPTVRYPPKVTVF